MMTPRDATRSVRSGQHGFTLIELMVSLALLGALAVAVLPVSEMMMKRRQEQLLRQSLRDIRHAIDAYKHAADHGWIDKVMDESGYPPDLNVLVNGVADKRSLQGGSLYFLRRIPRDPMCDCPATDAAGTWQLRSYDSPPDAPQAGADVFDVSSRSTQEGLNGIAYDQW